MHLKRGSVQVEWYGNGHRFRMTHKASDGGCNGGFPLAKLFNRGGD